MKSTGSRTVLSVGAAVAAIVLIRCGQSNNPAAANLTPTPTQIPVSTAAPTPTDCQLPHDGNPGCIPPCSFGHGTGDGIDCPFHGKYSPVLFNAVRDAVLATEAENPQLISQEGGVVRLSLNNRLPFFRIVIHRLQATPGLCAADDGLEVAIKNTNDFSEQYKFWTTPPKGSDLGSIRLDSDMHVATCTPAWF